MSAESPSVGVEVAPRRGFANRAELIDHLTALHPDIVTWGDEVSPIRGGRAAALEALGKIDPPRYERSRNYLNGAVSRLSPYLRHGVLTLAEVRDHALGRVERPDDAAKFVNELGWRDYWQRVYERLGDGIWRDREPYKTGASARQYATELPEEIAEGRTGMACVDGFAHELRETGYLHNHARMWLAAYVVHWRKVRWQAGATWFLEHLLDGDPASNNLSWQWVASTFSNKPYFFNRENLEKYTGGQYCRSCPLKGRCDFEGSYDRLEQRLFPHGVQPGDGPAGNDDRVLGRNGNPAHPRKTDLPYSKADPVLIWVHEDALNPQAKVFRTYPEAPALFVWDDSHLRDLRAPYSFKRLVFLAECVEELPNTVEVARGEPASLLAQAIARVGAKRLVVADTINPRVHEILNQVEKTARVPVEILSEDPFLPYDGPMDLKRFSRYWRTAERYAMGVGGGRP